MPLLDSIQDAVNRVLPEKKSTLPMPMSTTGGIGNTGMMPFEDDVRTLTFSGPDPWYMALPYEPKLSNGELWQ